MGDAPVDLDETSSGTRGGRRLYYKIGEACRLVDIQPYVLRYWETEFPQLAPNKSRSGQRVYSESELAIIRRIKQLLYVEGFTIAGAKKRLESDLAGGLLEQNPTIESESGDAEVEPSVRESSPIHVTLDTRASEQIERLRHGIGTALRQAREILARLS